MGRAIVSKTVLDSLIRAKLASIEPCAQVEPLPVAWNENPLNGCNWVVPGWAGEGPAVRLCLEKIAPYLGFLQAQFDIPPDRASMA